MRAACPLLALIMLSGTSAAQRVPVYLTLMGEPVLGARGERQPFYRWFAEADANRDGSMDMVEMQKDAARFFATLDVDHDGRIGPDEITRYETEVAPPAVRAAGGLVGVSVQALSPTSRNSEPPITGTRLANQLDGPGANLGEVPEPVTAADTNLNGSVSAGEFNSAASRRFFGHDTNHDGRLDPKELMSDK
jgi:hypothetical protein